MKNIHNLENYYKLKVLNEYYENFHVQKGILSTSVCLKEIVLLHK